MIKITIESGFAMPKSRQRSKSDLGVLRHAILTMKPGQSFVFTKNNRHPYLAARQVGCRVATEKINGGWLVHYLGVAK